MSTFDLTYIKIVVKSEFAIVYCVHLLLRHAEFLNMDVAVNDLYSYLHINTWMSNSAISRIQ